MAVTAYAVPETLTPAYDTYPFSLQAFFRLRIPSGSTGRMWNMLMARPMHVMPVGAATN